MIKLVSEYDNDRHAPLQCVYGIAQDTVQRLNEYREERATTTHIYAHTHAEEKERISIEWIYDAISIECVMTGM